MTPEEMAREREASRARRAAAKAAAPKHVPLPRSHMGGAFHVPSRRQRLRAALADEFLPPRTMEAPDA